MKNFFCVGFVHKKPINIFSCKEGNYSEKFSCLTKLQKATKRTEHNFTAFLTSSYLVKLEVIEMI